MTRPLTPRASIWRLWCLVYYEARIALARDPLHHSVPRYMQRVAELRSAP